MSRRPNRCASASQVTRTRGGPASPCVGWISSTATPGSNCCGSPVCVAGIWRDEAKSASVGRDPRGRPPRRVLQHRELGRPDDARRADRDLGGGHLDERGISTFERTRHAGGRRRHRGGRLPGPNAHGSPDRHRHPRVGRAGRAGAVLRDAGLLVHDRAVGGRARPVAVRRRADRPVRPDARLRLARGRAVQRDPGARGRRLRDHVPAERSVRRPVPSRAARGPFGRVAGCGADASTRARAIRPIRMPASRRRLRTWTAPTSTSGSSRSCRPIPTTSTATATASGAKNDEPGSARWRCSWGERSCHNRSARRLPNGRPAWTLDGSRPRASRRATWRRSPPSSNGTTGSSGSTSPPSMRARRKCCRTCSASTRTRSGTASRSGTSPRSTRTRTTCS